MNDQGVWVWFESGKKLGPRKRKIAIDALIEYNLTDEKWTILVRLTSYQGQLPTSERERGREQRRALG